MRWLSFAALLSVSFAAAPDVDHKRYGMDRVDVHALDASYERSGRAAFRPRIGVVEHKPGRQKIAPKHGAAGAMSKHHEAEHKKEVDWAAKLQHAVEHMVKEAQEQDEKAPVQHASINHKVAPNLKHANAANAKHQAAKQQAGGQHKNAYKLHLAAASPQEDSHVKAHNFPMRAPGDPSSCVATVTATVTAQASTATITVTPARTTTTAMTPSSTTSPTSMPTSYTTSAFPAACTGTAAICPCASGYECRYVGSCEWECLSSSATPTPTA